MLTAALGKRWRVKVRDRERRGAAYEHVHWEPHRGNIIDGQHSALVDLGTVQNDHTPLIGILQGSDQMGVIRCIA